MTTSQAQIDSAMIRQYRTQGYLVVPNLFTPVEVAAVNERLSQIAHECDHTGRHPLPGVALEFESGSQPGPVSGPEKELLIRKYHDLGQADPFFWDHLRDPRLLGVLAGLIGPGAQLLQCMALVKPPAIGAAKDWHQDIAYFPLTPAAAIGVWIACDDADLENGCMQVVPGSHLTGVQEHEQGPTGWRLADRMVAARATDIVALPMAAGSALFFDSVLWHFTGHNSSARRRRAVQYHYVARDTRIAQERTLWSLEGLRPPRLESTRAAETLVGG
jgi:phytanoyl-CoA hydroxylase